MSTEQHPAEIDVLNVLRQHGIGAFNGSQVACSSCRSWMTTGDYQQHLAALIVISVIPPASTDRPSAKEQP